MDRWNFEWWHFFALYAALIRPERSEEPRFLTKFISYSMTNSKKPWTIESLPD